MPALKAERWARHAITALNRTDLDAREEIKQLGFLGFYLVGLQALAGGNVEQVDALMNEMLPQIQIMEPAITRPLTPDCVGDIEEVTTLGAGLVVEQCVQNAVPVPLPVKTFSVPFIVTVSRPETVHVMFSLLCISVLPAFTTHE